MTAVYTKLQENVTIQRKFLFIKKKNVLDLKSLNFVFRPAFGGKYCIGTRIQYRSCNTHKCPHGTIDFRSKQCLEFNGQTFGIKGLPSNVKWVPNYAGSKFY